MAKKSVRSVRIDEAQGTVSSSEHFEARTRLAALSQFVLPLPTDAHERRLVLVNAAASYFVALLGLALAHIPYVIHSVPSSFLQALTVLRNEITANHLAHLLIYGGLLSLLSYAHGLFEEQGDSLRENFFAIVNVAFWATLVYGIALYLCRATVDKMMLAGQGAVAVVGLVTVAMLRSRVLPLASSFRTRRKNVLIVGTTRTARQLARQIAKARNGDRVVKGFIGRFRNNDPAVLGTVDDLARIAGTEFVDEIIVAGADDRELAERAVREGLRSHLDVSVVPDLLVEWPSKANFRSIGPIPLIALHEEAIPRFGLFVKRVVDVVISAAALLLTLPLTIAIAAAIKLDSEGPVLYRALRAGKKGRSFACYKFRTMYADADCDKDRLRSRNERQGPTFKIRNDPRITPVGRVLRRYSLDEVPQLWNVLTGSMSIVGPRPHPLDDYARYSPEDRRRLDVSPGITGLWQVTARNDPSFATNMFLDLEYIENWSLGMDTVILLKTIPAVLRGTGA